MPIRSVLRARCSALRQRCAASLAGPMLVPSGRVHGGRRSRLMGAACGGQMSVSISSTSTATSTSTSTSTSTFSPATSLTPPALTPPAATAGGLSHPTTLPPLDQARTLADSQLPPQHPSPSSPPPPSPPQQDQALAGASAASLPFFSPSEASFPSPSTTPNPTPTMANEAALRKTLTALKSASPKSKEASTLLSTAKKQLMQLDALIPGPQTPATLLPLARAALEAGALLSIGAEDPDAFTRYYQQLQPFYALPATAYQPSQAAGEHQRSKITGLYLLLLLTKGDYAGFHTLLEVLEAESESEGADQGLENDRFIRYPVELERALMEGAYDRVWKATKGEGVPSEEFGAFSEILIGTIRDEIASCSEKAYPSIPVANAKNLLFLDSEGSVVNFAQKRGWVVRDGRLYFPSQQNEGVRTEKEILVTSGQVIENTIGYARELETIV